MSEAPVPFSLCADPLNSPVPSPAAVAEPAINHLAIASQAITTQAITSQAAGKVSDQPLVVELFDRKAADSIATSVKQPRLFSWRNILWIAVLHVGCLAALLSFSWQGVVLFFVLHWVTGGLGVCLGYHRLFSHASFDTYRPVRWFIAALGGLAGEGPVIDWVSNHRKHHALSDREGDPHSPRDGAWWSHLLWIGYGMSREEYAAHVQRWAPDLRKDRVLRWLSPMFIPSQIVLAAILFASGYWFGGMALGVSLVLWGMCARLVFVMHSTWFVNSVSHMWGYRNYETNDDSRNSWWVALLTYGEGWHNNHHAFPRMAKHGHRWWEYDVTFLTIRCMEFLGLAWQVVDYKNRRVREVQANRGS